MDFNIHLLGCLAVGKPYFLSWAAHASDSTGLCPQCLPDNGTVAPAHSPKSKMMKGFGVTLSLRTSTVPTLWLLLSLSPTWGQRSPRPSLEAQVRKAVRLCWRRVEGQGGPPQNWATPRHPPGHQWGRLPSDTEERCWKLFTFNSELLPSPAPESLQHCLGNQLPHFKLWVGTVQP